MDCGIEGLTVSCLLVIWFVNSTHCSLICPSLVFFLSHILYIVSFQNFCTFPPHMDLKNLFVLSII